MSTQVSHRKTIVTRWLGTTNVRGTRIKATIGHKSVILSYDYEVNIDENHKTAALALRDRMGWKGDMIGGEMPNRDYCWIFVD